MTLGLTLVCPVRGRLKVKARSSDGLSPTEERFRVEAIKHLVSVGYPVENIRTEAVIKKFGNKGRNHFRADLVVLDTPVSSISHDPDEVLAHAVLLGEVKRDNKDAAEALDTQVRPMLDFAARDDCVALYWDNVEQRVFWTTRSRGTKQTHEGPLASLPGYGERPGQKKLKLDDLDPDKPLLDVFKRIEDILHAASIGPSRRFNVMMQLLLAKLHDEHKHTSDNKPLAIQDYAALGVSAPVAAKAFNDLLGEAVKYYQKFMPERLSQKLEVTPDVLLDVTRVLAPIKIVEMRRSVIQDFYMYFAKHIYKWDLAQYFTPTPLTEFIVDVLNPQWGEHLKDPACGSADFLTAAFRRGSQWPDYASSIWGTDVSPEAVQVGVLNMVLNGDGKTNIIQEDSLLKVEANEESCDIVICNPPFGTRITDTRQHVLSRFDLGHRWETTDDGKSRPTAEVLKSQEVGILFAELCVRLLRPGGRMALIVPNGYLGNRSERYSYMREWLLRNCRVAAVVGLPRFTFKSSGADVSASVIFCERRANVLAESIDTDDYDYAVELISRVGWNTGDKKGAPLYKRDDADGTLILDDNDDPVLDSDFDDVLARIRASDASAYFPWLAEGIDTEETEAGWTQGIDTVIDDPLLTLDPKRLSRKHLELRDAILSGPSFRLGDVVDFMAEGFDSVGTSVEIDSESRYRYVEIQDVGRGQFGWTERPGWDLPARARHIAEPADIYVGGIWNSVKKWFIAPRDVEGLIVTNGMHRLRLKPGKEAYLPDLVAGLCTEAYSVQMRAMARGSDGLAEVNPEDASEVVFARLKNSRLRVELQPFVDRLMDGQVTIEAKVASLASANRLPIPTVEARDDHTGIV